MPLTPQDYLQAVKEETIIPRFKVEFLYPDESIMSEITQDISDESGSLTINYSQGCRRSCNLTLKNVDKKYIPNPNGLWVKQKFKLYLGLNINGEDYFIPNGVFILANPEALHYGSEKKLTLVGYDKFSVLDGQLGGEIDSVYQIENGSSIYDAIKSILSFDAGNGYSIDTIEPILDAKYSSATIPYTIRKEPGTPIGQILIELANAISCDIFYDSNGHLRVENSTDDITATIKPSLWTYTTDELEYLGSSVSYQFDKLYTTVRVIGDNINGEIFDAVSENTNPFSSTRVGFIPRRTKVISDDIIYSTDLAQQRADYELKKISILQTLVRLESSFMGHLDVNNNIQLSDEYYGFENQRFVIQSLNIPLSIGSKISIDASNIGDLPFYNQS